MTCDFFQPQISGQISVKTYSLWLPILTYNLYNIKLFTGLTFPKANYSKLDKRIQHLPSLHDREHWLFACHLDLPAGQSPMDISYKNIFTIFYCRIPLSPSLCLLGDTTSILIPQKWKYPLLVSLTIARKIVFQNWKSRDSCHINHWINLISKHILTEELSAQKKNNTSAFKDIWNPFIFLTNSAIIVPFTFPTRAWH